MKLPLRVDHREIRSADDGMIIYNEGGYTNEDAAFIVRAVNCHMETLRTLKLIAQTFPQLEPSIAKAKIYNRVLSIIAKAESK